MAARTSKARLRPKKQKTTTTTTTTSTSTISPTSEEEEENLLSISSEDSAKIDESPRLFEQDKHHASQPLEEGQSADQANLTSNVPSSVSPPTRHHKHRWPSNSDNNLTSSDTRRQLQRAGNHNDTGVVFSKSATLNDYGLLLVLPIVAILVIVGLYFLIRKLWQDFCGDDSNDAGASSSASDKKTNGSVLANRANEQLNNIKMLGQQAKGKAQQDGQHLTDNMESDSGKSGKRKKSDDDLGKLRLKLDYDFNNTDLAVGVIEAAGLPAMDLCGTSDPYVKVYLMPDKKKKFETKVHRKTLNPIFNETFHFKHPYAEITTKTLVFAIYDFDRFSKHDQIGEVKIALNSIDLAQTIEEWRPLTKVATDADQVSQTSIHLAVDLIMIQGKLSLLN